MAAPEPAPYGWIMTVPPRLRRALLRMRRDLAFVAAGVPLHLVPALLSWRAISLLADTVNGVSSEAPVELIALLSLLVIAGYGFTEAQRWRFRAVCGVELPRLRFTEGKRQLGYNWLVGPLLGVLELLLLALLLAALVAALVLVWVWLVPPQWRRGHPGYTIPGAYLTVLGLVALAVIPGLAAGLVRLEILVGRAVLGVSRSEELARRVEDLTESRAGAVDAADAEQPAYRAGPARRRTAAAGVPGAEPRARQGHPHGPAAGSTGGHRCRAPRGEGRDRGTQPSGAWAASGRSGRTGAGCRPVGARGPRTAARTAAGGSRRRNCRSGPHAAVEAVAYFVVSEALTNIAKHAREATRAEVTVTRLGEILRVVIADDGMGGADPAKGSGLKGLAQRVRSVDGTLRMSSPVGGPTMMSVELPCPM